MKRLANHGDFLLLHRLQHRRLRLGRRTVDLVRQHQVGEDRTMHKFELASTTCHVLQDIRTGNVHGHQIGCELDPAKLQGHRFGEFPD